MTCTNANANANASPDCGMTPEVELPIITIAHEDIQQDVAVTSNSIFGPTIEIGISDLPDESDCRHWPLMLRLPDGYTLGESIILDGWETIRLERTDA